MIKKQIVISEEDFNDMERKARLWDNHEKENAFTLVIMSNSPLRMGKMEARVRLIKGKNVKENTLKDFTIQMNEEILFEQNFALMLQEFLSKVDKVIPL